MGSSDWRKKYEDLAKKFEENLKDWEKQAECWSTKYTDLLEDSSKDFDTLRAKIDNSKLEASELRKELILNAETYREKENNLLKENDKLTSYLNQSEIKISNLNIQVKELVSKKSDI